MIMREMRPVNVVTFSSGVDEYGQQRKGASSTRSVDMVIKIYSQSSVSDIRYVDVSTIGLTYDKEITDSNQIIIDGITYEVLYVIPSRTLTTVMMKKA